MVFTLWLDSGLDRIEARPTNRKWKDKLCARIVARSGRPLSSKQRYPRVSNIDSVSQVGADNHSDARRGRTSEVFFQCRAGDPEGGGKLFVRHPIRAVLAIGQSGVVLRKLATERDCEFLILGGALHGSSDHIGFETYVAKLLLQSQWGSDIFGERKMATGPIPSYGSPPITEVAFGVQFPAVALQTRHIGQFWTEVSGEYPLTQDFPPIPDAGEVPGVSFLVLPPLRRVFLTTANTEFVVQLQDSRFHHNWRKLSPASDYPRFGVVFKRFLSAWGRFSDFVKRQGISEPTPCRYELTYVNEIETLGDVRVEQAVKLFDWKNVQSEFLPEPQATNIAWSFLLPDSKGVMNVSTNRLVKPDGRSSVLLTLACAGPSANDRYSLDDWFETAHQLIVRGFSDLTTSEAHGVWKREV